MVHQVLFAQSAGQFFRPARVVELAILHPLVALGVALWMGAAYCCAAIAETKGRDDQLWGFFGLLLGILPLIAVLALPPAEPGSSSISPLARQRSRPTVAWIPNGGDGFDPARAWYFDSRSMSQVTRTQ